MKKTLALVLALVFVLTAFAGCSSAQPGSKEPAAADTAAPAPAGEPETAPPAASGETYKFIVGLTKNENNTTALQNYLNSIEEASNGQIEFEIYFNSSLLAVAEMPQGLATGVADICEFMLSEFPTIFPLSSTVMGLPFMGMDFDTGEAFRTLYNETPEMQAEFANAGMVMLNYLVTAPYNLHLTTDKSVRLPADLKGLKVITTRVDMSDFITANGGAPVSCAPPDFYSNLEKGVVDGTVLHLNMALNNGLIPLFKQNVMVSDIGGFYSDISCYVMSQAAMDRLPADLQALFTDSDRIAEFFAGDRSQLLAQHEEGLALAIEQGNDVHYMTDDELLAWEDALAPITNARLQELENQGLPAFATYEHAKEIIASMKGE